MMQPSLKVEFHLSALQQDLNADGSNTVNWGLKNKMSIHELKKRPCSSPLLKSNL